MNYKQRLKSAAIWSLISSLLGKGGPLIASIYIAQKLGVIDFGAFSIIQSTVIAAVAFSTLGLGLAVTKLLAEHIQKNQTYAGNISAAALISGSLSGCIIYSAIITFAPEIATNILSSSLLDNAIITAAPTVIFLTINAITTGILTGLEKFKLLAKINFIGGATTSLALIFGASLWGLNGALIGLVLGSGSTTVIMLLGTQNIIREEGLIVPRLPDPKTWSSLFKFAVPALLASISVAPANWYAATLLTHTNNGLEQLGLFNAANQWRLAAYFIPATIANSALPIITKILTIDPEQGGIIKTQLVAIAIFSCFIGAALFLSAPFIMDVYGKDYSNGETTLRILSISVCLMAINNAIGQLLTARSRMWESFGLNLIWACTLITTTYLLLDHLNGAEALAMATAIAYGLHTVLQLALLRQVRKVG